MLSQYLKFGDVMAKTVGLPLREQLKQAIRNLKKAGILVKVWVDEKAIPQTGYILVDINSIADIVKNRIAYPNKNVYVKDNYLIIEVWKD